MDDLTTQEALISTLESQLWYLGDHSVPQKRVPRDLLRQRLHDTLDQLKAKHS